MTGSGVMIIFVFKELIRYPEIRNTPVWVLLNTKFGTNISNKMLLNAEKCQCYRFYCFWESKGKPAGGMAKLPHHQD